MEPLDDEQRRCSPLRLFAATAEQRLTFGMSCYILDHSYKIQADYSRLWSDRPSTGDDRVRPQAEVSF